ncbi:MAG: threonine synthase [Coriobacteriia bacterium]|nr:threonine synthase [Coriobacteriia bacterium]
MTSSQNSCSINQPRSSSTCYIDTRGQITTPLPFSTIIINGLADGGGLYVPVDLPTLTIEEIVNLTCLPYAQRAAKVFECFNVDFDEKQIESLMQAAYGDNFDSNQIAPVVKVAEQTFLLELTHGPTSAFKDMALQCLPHFFSAALEQGESSAAAQPSPAVTAPATTAQPAQHASPAAQPPLHLILVATSGDTGSAALSGFKNRANTALIVYYPREGVSDIQRRQMTTAEGNNIAVVAVEGNFDDCQAAVKAIFSDTDFAQTLAEQNVTLSSANSINWGRLLPQVVYYVNAYTQLVAQNAITSGQLVDVCVPTGNFGNILAAWYAKKIGTPIGLLYCASNVNHVLTDFINTGTYDISDRLFTVTPSPSMDILVSSNLERQLFELNGRNSDLIIQWMTDLGNNKKFQVDKTTFAALREDFTSDWVTSEESLSTICDVYDQHQYLLDPHTAVAWKVAERLRPAPDTPVLIASTAHWSKFPEDVYRALHQLLPGDELPAEVSSMTGSELIDLINRQYSSTELPENLASLYQKPIRFTEARAATNQDLMQSILDFIENRSSN